MKSFSAAVSCGLDALKKVLVLSVLVFGIVLFAVGCGKDGTIYGMLTHDGSVSYLSVGGFPIYVYFNNYYEVDPDTYQCYYTLWDGVDYFPAWFLGIFGALGANYYWKYTYTVKADKGSFPFVDGDDREFELYLAYEGLYKYGDVKSLASPPKNPKELTPRLGTYSWTEGGLRITVTGEIVKLSPEDVAKLQQTQAKNK